MTAALLPALRALFGTVLRMSLAGGAAALVCLLAEWGLRRLHAPRAFSAALWLVVLVRLICPVGLPVPVGPRAAALLPQAGQEARGGQLLLRFEGAMPDQTPVFSAWDALALVWLTVACVLLLRAGLRTARLRRSVRTAWREEADGIVYYTGACVATPFVLGLLRPRIYLPAGLDAAERRHILLHERAHLRHGDHWLRPLYYLASCIHWFDPLAWLAFGCARRESEALCDEAVLRALGEQAKAEYCRSLLRFAAARPARGSAVAFGEGSIKMRIQEILNYRRPALWATVCGGIAALAVGAACLTTPVRAEAPAAVSVPAASTSTAVNGHHADPHAGHSTTHHAEPHTQYPTAHHTETLLWPVPDYTYVSRWCHEATDANGAAHQGADIAAAAGADIVAAASGTVTYADFDAGYGWMVVIDHGNGSSTRYAHCLELCVEAGQTVTQGQKIAAVGNSGKSTGYHCHFEVMQDGECLQVQTLFDSYAQP